ncbi:MAG: nicotinate phosphoribosyltransferase [Actinobacteria bacterium]|nr:nicotinate phosphoribosyltransferase [Actinomycetota bacterium]
MTDAHVGPGPLGLFTDLYELRMAATCLLHGETAPATFSLYVRPDAARPWMLHAGTSAVLDLLDRFSFGQDELDYLASDAIGLEEGALEWLADLELTGELWAVPDGTLVLGDEPLMEFTGPLPQAMLLETAIMAVAGFPTLIATKAARCHVVAEGAQLADFGARRAHGLEAGLEAARSAYIGGVGATSNVEAGRRFGIPVVGTMAHSFIQAYDDEVAAFTDFAEDHPGNAIMLVDTYDTLDGVRHAITVGERLRERGQELTGVRLDSGDLAQLARESRKLLDEAGFDEAQIFASGGMDEFEIRRLLAQERAPIDAFGIGTSLTTSRDHPAFDIVYKLVEYDGIPRAKYSEGKTLLPGAKQVFRPGGADTDVLGRRDDDVGGRPLLQAAWRDGRRLIDTDLEGARSRAERELEGLPSDWRDPAWPHEAPGPRVSPALADLAEQVRERELG